MRKTLAIGIITDESIYSITSKITTTPVFSLHNITLAYSEDAEVIQTLPQKVEQFFMTNLPRSFNASLTALNFLNQGIVHTA